MRKRSWHNHNGLNRAGAPGQRPRIIVRLPWLYSSALDLARTKSSLRLVQAAWVRCIARATRLDRDVAIKVLPEALAHDADRLARFEREAQVLASLNHPNIAAIYGLERATARKPRHGTGRRADARGSHRAGAMPVDEALPIAKQIAEALEAAHEQGIVHRDLKPANIKVRPEGTVKVLDFGLAKALDGAAVRRAPDAVADSPTIRAPMTGVGVILGTAAYMAPEQAAERPSTGARTSGRSAACSTRC